MATNKLACPVPSSLNPLSPNGFKFNITKIPEVSFFCQEVDIPDLSLGAVIMTTPLSSAPIPGEILTFGDLNIKFLVDENMDNYVAIHNWLVGLGYPESNDQYSNYIREANTRLNSSELAKGYSNATLQILGNTNSPIRNLEFVDLFPVSLGSLTFLSTTQDVLYLVGNASFKYTYYKFK